MSDDESHFFNVGGEQDLSAAQQPVLKNIYLSFFYGAKIGILGLNGSGNLLLKIIAGLDKNFQRCRFRRTTAWVI